MVATSVARIYSPDRSRSVFVQCWLPAPIVQRPRTPPFQGGNGDSNSPGGTHGGVVKSGVHAGLSSRRSRVQIPSLPPYPERSGHPVRAPWLQRTGQVAQMVEHRSEKPGVGGSIPPLTTISSLPTASGARERNMFRWWTQELRWNSVCLGAGVSVAADRLVV